MKILFWIIIGIPLLLAIANLLLRIVLGYWSPFFKWVLFSYLILLGGLVVAFWVFCRGVEERQELERQRTITDSLRRISEHMSSNKFRGKNISDLELKQFLKSHLKR